MNSFEEVMLEVYRLDHAEFDKPLGHLFSRRHSKAMKEILQPKYSMVSDYHIEQERIPPRKRILAAVLVIILALVGTAAGAAAISFLNRGNSADIKESIMTWNTTWYEDGMFYEVQNADGENVLCYYSKEKDRSAVMCGMPECTHRSKTSPDCGAIGGSNTHSRYGFNRIGDKLYYFSIILPDDGSIGSVDFIESDIDGKNRRVVASLEETYVPFITDVRYFDGRVLLTYYQNFDLVKNENTGEFEFVNLDKYRFYILSIDISTGKIETLVNREEYSGRGRGTIYENTLYYSYTYQDAAPTGEMLTPETAPTILGGLYIRDLSTGEEKLYEDIQPFSDSFNFFSPDGIMVYDDKNDKILRLNSETGKLTVIADYDYGDYTSDGKYALFDEGHDSEFWTRYDLETGELTKIPSSVSTKIYLISAYETGSTVWLELDPEQGKNSLQHAYIDKDDLYSGKYENIKVINEVELK